LQVAVTLPAAPAAAPPAAQSTETTPAAPAANGIVVVHTRGESWVEIVDAKGVIAVRKLMAPGESAGGTGALPLMVTIGRVDQTEVEVRGKKFDMRPVSKDNVARFEVK
jgi:cytoskeleton protein RodZ